MQGTGKDTDREGTDKDNIQTRHRPRKTKTSQRVRVGEFRVPSCRY